MSTKGECAYVDGDVDWFPAIRLVTHAESIILDLSNGVLAEVVGFFANVAYPLVALIKHRQCTTLSRSEFWSRCLCDCKEGK